ncbi:hypothetical protein [Diaphorobacter aerolatus]|uniref:Uncharacterized protein n=1 Tax=Diaphorobacter aerolatus TaxID=1288495 RepID=A0A7H0GM27_9BURK|nr:hypothetical protein [Diaphorobacter aerolatus]QNP49343.1 hypothetical protein H9K75_04600 [Diaphorobacter aerolatus]
MIRREMLADGGNYEEFIEQLYADIDESIYELQASRELRQNDTEDRISLDILVGLKRSGYNATHDSKTGGHVDLAVRIGSHSWIGEAKKDGNFKEGFLQLTSRYVQASGNYSHDQGGLLFYMVKRADALGVLNIWRRQLMNDGHSCIDCNTNKLAFYSKHKLEGSGTDFKIRSMVISLYHQPLDKSARDSAKRRAAKKAPMKNSAQKKST